MRFWDSSAIIPIVFVEPASASIRELAEDGSPIQVWWAAIVECASAIARRERRGELEPGQVREAQVFLGRLAAGWIEVPALDRIRDAARRLVAVHDLRAADAFHLAAALAASEGQPESLPFVTLDERLALAATREGFPVLP